MIDPFVLLAPVLLLGVVALLRFVGCNPVFGIHETRPSPTVKDFSPISATQGDPDFELVATGNNFVKEETILWNGSPTVNQPSFISSTEWRVTITTAEIATPGDVTVALQDGSDTFPYVRTFIVISSDVSVTFNNPGAVDTPLAGIYDGKLDFGPPGAEPWYWKGAGMGTAIYLGPPGASGTVTGHFSFANMPPAGRVLRRIRVIADPVVSGNITISDTVNPAITKPVIAGSAPTFIETMWTNQSQTITIVSDIGWDIAIDAIVYRGPA